MAADISTLPRPTTRRPAAEARPPVPQGRRVTAGMRQSEAFALFGSMASALGMTWLLFTQLAPFNGGLGWIVTWWVFFVLIYAVATSLDESGPAVRDRIAGVVIQSLALLLLVGLIFVVVYVLYRGSKAFLHWNFFTQDMSQTGPLEPLTSGGVIHAVVGTLEQILISLVITVPLGLSCAVFLNEFRGPFPRFVRTIVEAMTALPSIVAGLFIFTTYILTLGFDKSGFAAALALSIMMLPIIVRAADVVIRLVPGSLREASYAMGAGKWRTVLVVVLPTARSGLATAIILGTARGIGETSPVLLTAGFASAMNANPFNGPQVSLPLLAFELFKFPQETMHERALGAATVLLILVIGLFFTARTIGGRGAGVLTERQMKRRAAQSHQDAERFVARAHARLGTVPPPAPSPLDPLFSSPDAGSPSSTPHDPPASDASHEGLPPQ